MVEVYHGNTVYLDGQYTREHLKRVLTTMDRISEVNERLGREAAPEGFKTMEETAAPIVEAGWITNRKGPQ